MQKIMKYNLCLLLILCSCIAFGQKPNAKQADLLFAKKSYVKAAEMYEQLEPNKQILQNLGDSYYFNAAMHDAARSYGLLLFTHKNDSIDPEYSFKYAHALLGIDNITKADSVMAIYTGFPVDTRAFITNLITNVPYNYRIQLMAKNKTNGDFGMSFFGEKVVFASYRNAKNPVYKWNEKPYLD